MNFNKITDDVIKETDTIINQFGPRLAGTKASLDTADYLYEDAKGYSDNVYKEDFYINKGAPDFCKYFNNKGTFKLY